jgi:hypothetical protein
MHQTCKEMHMLLRFQLPITDYEYDTLYSTGTRHYRYTITIERRESRDYSNASCTVQIYCF